MIHEGWVDPELGLVYIPVGMPLTDEYGGHRPGNNLFGDSIVWLGLKMSAVLFVFLWIRATFPRYRYDQIMRLGWKVFIPITLIWIIFLGAMMQTRWAYLFH